MDLRNLPDGLSPSDRCEERRKMIEQELNTDLSALQIDPSKLGTAEEKNCEQMFGHVPVPVGLAGPLDVKFSSGENTTVHLPLATTEGALVASVNRGCKALTAAGGVRVQSVYHGISRSIAFKSNNQTIKQSIIDSEDEWKSIGESTSNHLKILTYDIDTKDDYLFLTLNCDTSEAMGMNMVTICAQAVGKWIEQHCDCQLITVAGNVDSDKKPSKRTHDRGRGYEVTAEAHIPMDVIETILKSSPEAMLEVAKAKLEAGSSVAGALGANLHAANIVAALYLATGQDAAHIVEGSLTDTTIKQSNNTLSISIRCPAILVGVRGGGTSLPAQKQCLDLLLKPNNQQPNNPTTRLAESIGAAILAGELSLLAAQAAQELASSHKKLGR